MPNASKSNAHATRMQAKKKHIDKRIEEANTQQSVIVLLTGNGKGKSSSALGMIARSLGWGQRVVWVSFLKGAIETGEKRFFANTPNLTYIEMPSGFTWDSQNKEEDTQKAKATWAEAKPYLQDESIDIIIFDELTYMLNYDYLDIEILESIKHRTLEQSIIITGRAANVELHELADTVSEVKDIKHAFNDNITARKGVDY